MGVFFVDCAFWFRHSIVKVRVWSEVLYIMLDSGRTSMTCIYYPWFLQFFSVICFSLTVGF